MTPREGTGTGSALRIIGATPWYVEYYTIPRRLSRGKKFLKNFFRNNYGQLPDKMPARLYEPLVYV
jgi:hypothetical protein